MKIHSVSTADRGSGAEYAAWELFQGLKRAGWESWLVVGDRRTDDPHVVPFYASPHIDYRPYQSAWHRRRLKVMRRWDAWWGHQDYRHPYSHRLLELTGTSPDVVHLHNLHGGYFDLHAVPEISRRVPTFVTLQDCWWFTGHCAYPLQCDRWKSGCGRCPMLKIPPEAKRRDGTRYNWKRKQRIYRRSRFYVAAPSRWILDRARESMFQSAIEEARVIPNGVDLENFRPSDSQRLREKLNIPADSFVAAFSAARATSNPFKDYQTVLAALKLSAAVGERPVELLAIGEEAPTERWGRLTVRHIGFLNSPGQLGEMYRAADVMLHAAHRETFGVVLAEAMACGLPVVATGVDGIPEVVAHGETGLLVPHGDAEAMAAAIERLRENRELRLRMGRAARARAEAKFGLPQMIESYRTWYEDVLERTSARASA